MRIILVLLFCIYGCCGFDSVGLQDNRRVKRRLNDNSHNLEYCERPAKCLPLKPNAACLGVKLPYSHTAFDGSEEKVEAQLLQYNNSIYFPRCWPLIQPFLCSHFMPKCKNDTINLPSRDMCKRVQKLCLTFFNIINVDFDCDDENLFPTNCRGFIASDFNTTRGDCLSPMIKTDQDDSFYPGIDGCGLSCKDPFYTDNEQRQIFKLVGYGVFFCLILTGVTICTFMIDWKSANKYPAVAIFYVNVCFFVMYCGWLIQFLGSETREDIVCKKDGTLRISEPRTTENLSCVSVFVMVYYFLIAGMVWFVIFSYSWYMNSLQALGKTQERVDKKRAYFHLLAWSLPLMLTITTMALNEIDGDYTSGICFVGGMNSAARAGLLLAPLGVTITISGYIILRGLILLIKVKMESREIISIHASKKIKSNICRMGVFALFMILFCIISFMYYIYQTVNFDSWNQSLHNYFRCKIRSLSEHDTCKLETRPSLAILQLQLIAAFGSGIAMASWIWCTATVHSWSRYIRKKFRCEVDEPMKLQKHQIIAQAFAKRKQFNKDGRISIEFENHTDPVGLNFELNSAASGDLSTTWAANLPRLVNRRFAVPNEAPHSFSSNNHSVDSEMSFSVRHVSIESRRNSMDSQVSVQIAELKATRKANRRHRYRQKQRNNVSRASGITRKVSKRRESNTSLESHFGAAQLLNALAITGKDAKPNLNRRSAIAGIDDILSNGKLVIPYNNKRSASEDETENVSVTISESKFNVVVSNNLDLNDRLVMKSLRQGLHIEELKTSTDCDSDSDNAHDSESSSCPELKQLVQSSMNSTVSIGFLEKNRGSKQSKTSVDVAVQANAKDILTQTAAYDNGDEKLILKSKESSKHRNDQMFEKIRKSKEKYRDFGSDEEKASLNI